MPESIILHFSAATASEVLAECAAFVEKVPERELYFHPSNPDYLFLLTPYKDYAWEYEAKQRALIHRMLGSEPLGAVDFELKRSRSAAACDAAVKIITGLSREFSFVIDDNRGRIWTANDAIDTAEFLRPYRY